MKRFVLAGVAALALVTTMGAANAADLSRPYVKAPPPYYPPSYNWTGFYMGINGGWGFGQSKWSNPFGSSEFDVSGGLVGGTIGYNYQVGQAVLGLEGDADWSDIHGSSSDALCVGVTCETRNNWLATTRGRIGYAFDRVMPFITGGAAFGDIKMTPVAFGTSQTDTKVGWTAGGGAEFNIAGPWSAKLEYLYVDLGKATCDVATCGVSTDVNFHTNLVRAGLNYRF